VRTSTPQLYAHEGERDRFSPPRPEAPERHSARRHPCALRPVGVAHTPPPITLDASCGGDQDLYAPRLVHAVKRPAHGREQVLTRECPQRMGEHGSRLACGRTRAQRHADSSDPREETPLPSSIWSRGGVARFVAPERRCRRCGLGDLLSTACPATQPCCVLCTAAQSAWLSEAGARHLPRRSVTDARDHVAKHRGASWVFFEGRAARSHWKQAASQPARQGSARAAHR